MLTSNPIRLLGMLILALLAVLPPSVTAAPSSGTGDVSYQVTCYEGAVDISGPLYPNQSTYTRELRTTSRCADINLKFTSVGTTTYVTAVRCSDRSPFTTEKRVEYVNRWYVIASNVIDGTCFRLRIRSADSVYTHSYVGKVAM